MELQEAVELNLENTKGDDYELTVKVASGGALSSLSATPWSAREHGATSLSTQNAKP